jgi:hypothetical protein
MKILIGSAKAFEAAMGEKRLAKALCIIFAAALHIAGLSTLPS